MDLLSAIVILGLIPVAILLAINICLHRSRIGRCVDKIPGPKGLPIIGNYLDFVVPVDEIFLQLRKFSKQFYPTYKYWILHRPVVNIRHPDDVELILSNINTIEKSTHVSLLEPWLNEGLLISTGDKWRGRRKMLNPAFTNSLLQKFVETFAEQTERLVRSLKAETSAQDGVAVKNVEQMFSRLSLNIICETAMGISLDDKDRDQYAYINAIPVAAQIFQFRFMRPWLSNNWIFSLTKMGKQHDKVLKIIHGFSGKIIQMRKDYHRANGWRYLEELSEENTQEEIEGKKKNRQRLALLDLLIAAWKASAIDDAGIQEEVDMFVVAGHDTTATALSFTTLLLAEHKDIQDKCREEINEVLNGIPMEKITIREVQRMHYLQQCIKEAMRLYAVAPLVSRKVAEDTKLKDYFVPRGTEVCVHVFDVHRDPHFWPNPDVFDPDRFSPERSKGRHPYSYLPFGLGPRACIGAKFAMLELKTVMAQLLSNFYLEPVDLIGDARFLMDAVIRLVDPAHVKLVPIIK
ncbi:cytochrome P450 4C1 [Diachasma alloeum]|uniref:cytochrome P450 4C1 n=1 Tax=Diachasma alloeum TaxID=454923 RepID=UPI0007382C85|nr:cytochrome P450 4C1 [Diachasma alloeum]